MHPLVHPELFPCIPIGKVVFAPSVDVEVMFLLKEWEPRFVDCHKYLVRILKHSVHLKQLRRRDHFLLRQNPGHGAINSHVLAKPGLKALFCTLFQLLHLRREDCLTVGHGELENRCRSVRGIAGLKASQVRHPVTGSRKG